MLVRQSGLFLSPGDQELVAQIREVSLSAYFTFLNCHVER